MSAQPHSAIETPEGGVARLFDRDLRVGFKLEALHCYSDKTAHPVFYRPRLRHPDGRKVIKPMHLKGGQFSLGEPAMPKGGKPLYRLPELVAADPAEIIWVAEGEGCADALAQAGVVATTSGSATSADGADWSPLQGRTVRIWPDNNEPGRQYADAVAQKLRELGCTVGIIDTTPLELPEGGDCVDLFGRWSDTANKPYLEALALVPDPVAEEDESVVVLRSLLTPWTDEELADAKTPWPHVFQDRHVGMFPEGEVSIIAAAGREGKTTVKIGIATAIVIGHSLADLLPLPNRSVIVYSAEDDRAQYARKVAAQVSLLSPQQGQWVKERLIVPNLDDLGHDAAKSLVAVFDGQPMVSGAVETIIEAIRPLMEGPYPPGLLIFETASTLSEAEENNAGFRLLILALRRIARTLRVAVVLSHHVSQASLSNLSDLNLSTADIRGATALVNNSRQTAMLVNLGCDEDPFPDADARTVLRRMAAPGLNERITALITLDSSKGIPPPPVFFRWVSTDWGPAAVEVDPPARLIGKPWRKVQEMVRAERAEVRDQAKAEKSSAVITGRIQRVLDGVAHLERMEPEQAITARRVRELVGMSAAVVGQALGQAVADGHLQSATVKVRGNETASYRLSRHGTDLSHAAGGIA